MSQKTLLALGFLLFALVSVQLFTENRRALDPATNQGWWAIGLAKPEDPMSLDFIIDNRASPTLFRYEIRRGEESLETGERSVATGETVTVTIGQKAELGTKTSIIVTTESERQEIYR